MKNKKLFIGLTSLLLVLGTGCNSKKEEVKPTPTPTPSDQGVKLLDADIENRVIDIDGTGTSKINCSVTGVKYRSSNENVVEVNAAGKVEAVGVGNAYITVTKEGYYEVN